MKSILHKCLVVTLVLILISHAVGVLLPETGFDALWYHLPIVKDMALTREIRQVPGVEQSNQPRLGEMVYVPGFLVGQELGVKVTAYLIMLVLLFLTFKFARLYLDETNSLVVTILVASFQTVAWGASSGYVDLLRAAFELIVYYFLLKPKVGKQDAWQIAGGMAGSLLTKLVSLLFLPSILLLVLTKRRFKLFVLLILVTAAIYVLGEYPISFFFSTGKNLIGISQVILSLRSFVALPWELANHAESYLSPLFLFVAPFCFIERKYIFKKLGAEIVFLLLSFLTWDFVVPISVRYDLSAIILATILCVVVILRTAKHYPYVRLLFAAIVVATVLINGAVRLGAHYRALPYLLGKETQSEYLARFDVGILKGPMEAWYKIK